MACPLSQITVTVAIRCITSASFLVELLSLVQVDSTPQAADSICLEVTRIWEGRLQVKRPFFYGLHHPDSKNGEGGRTSSWDGCPALDVLLCADPLGDNLYQQMEASFGVLPRSSVPMFPLDVSSVRV